MQTIDDIRGNKMASELVIFFDELPSDLSSLLEEAHSRYEHLIDITAGCFTTDVVTADRNQYPHFIKTNGAGMPIFNDNDCAVFMAQLYSLPELLCRMHVANDFHWTIASGLASDPEAMDISCADLKKHLTSNEKWVEVIEYLVSCGLKTTAIPDTH